jgi:hypothetical protein
MECRRGARNVVLSVRVCYAQLLVTATGARPTGFLGGTGFSAGTILRIAAASLDPTSRTNSGHQKMSLLASVSWNVGKKCCKMLAGFFATYA